MQPEAPKVELEKTICAYCRHPIVRHIDKCRKQSAPGIRIIRCMDCASALARMAPLRRIPNTDRLINGVPVALYVCDTSHT